MRNIAIVDERKNNDIKMDNSIWSVRKIRVIGLSIKILATIANKVLLPLKLLLIGLMW